MFKLFPLIWLTIFLMNTAEAATIKGTVTDSKTGNPIPGITVKIKGTEFGTITKKAVAILLKM